MRLPQNLSEGFFVDGNVTGGPLHFAHHLAPTLQEWRRLVASAPSHLLPKHHGKVVLPLARKAPPPTATN